MFRSGHGLVNAPAASLCDRGAHGTRSCEWIVTFSTAGTALAFRWPHSGHRARLSRSAARGSSAIHVSARCRYRFPAVRLLSVSPYRAPAEAHAGSLTVQRSVDHCVFLKRQSWGSLGQIGPSLRLCKCEGTLLPLDTTLVEPAIGRGPLASDLVARDVSLPAASGDGDALQLRYGSTQQPVDRDVSVLSWAWRRQWALVWLTCPSPSAHEIDDSGGECAGDDCTVPMS